MPPERSRPTKNDIARMLRQIAGLMEMTAQAMRQHPGPVREHGKEMANAARQVKGWINGIIAHDPCTSNGCQHKDICNRFDIDAKPTAVSDKLSSSLNDPGETCVFKDVDICR